MAKDKKNEAGFIFSEPGLYLLVTPPRFLFQKCCFMAVHIFHSFMSFQGHITSNVRWLTKGPVIDLLCGIIKGSDT